MLVQAIVEEDGTIKITDPQLKGKPITLNLQNQLDEEINSSMNWPEFWKALEEIDRLNLPPRTQEEIIKELREYREG